MPFFIGYAFGLLRAKGFFLFLRLGQETSPACLAGRGPFVQFLQSTLQCSTWNFFFLRYCLWLAAGQRLFSFPPARPRNQPGLCSGEGAFCPIPAKHLPMFHVELFLSSVLPLAFCRPKAFFFSSGSAQETSPACLAGRGPFVQFPAKHPSMFHMEHFSPFKMPKSRVLCALLVSIPLQVCYNNRRSPFSG